MIWASLLAAAGAFLLNLLILPLVLKLAHRFKWYDRPDSRKIHTGLIPRMGGPGLFLSFVLASVLAALALPRLTGGRLPAGASLLEPRLLTLFAGMAIVHLVGLYDDFKNLRAVWKFLLQLGAAAIITSGGFLIRSITLPYVGSINLGLAAYPLTMVWLVGIANALNLIDGMDGLAGGIAAFAAGAMGTIALLQGSTRGAVLSFALLGALAAFLLFNFPPARIFMGDSGSLFLGLTLAALPLAGGIPRSAAFGSLIVPVTLLTVPILDTATAILRRLHHRRSIISPDKQHIHHKLLAMGLSERQILTVIYGMCAYLALVSVTSVVLPKEINVYLIVVVWVGSLLGYWVLSYLELKNRKAETAARPEDDEASGSG